MIHFHIVTLFPESIDCYFKASMLKRAQHNKKIKISYYNPRDYTKNKNRRVDQKPYGGGPGMVLEAESVLRAASAAIGRKKDVEVIFFSPSGKQFTQAMAKKLANTDQLSTRSAKLLGSQASKLRSRTLNKHIVFICGHYEGVDARVAKVLKAKKVSVGPFVLTGGELPTAIVVDAITRHIPGVLGNSESIEETRTASPEVYTRPEVLKWKGKNYRVPEILLSGHHKKIEEWKRGRRK